MNPRIFVYFLCVALWECSHSSAVASSPIAERPITSVAKVTTPEEMAVLGVVQKVYKFKHRDFVCYWQGKPTKGNFVQRFRPYFSNEIVEHFFRDPAGCELVGSARYGFSPADNPDQWNDQQYVLVQMSKPEFRGDTATVEVRFWQRLDKEKLPTDQVHGGTIVYLNRVSNNWKISNFEGIDALGSNGFYSLIDNYSSQAKPTWKDMDYRNSLKNPQPYSN